MGETSDYIANYANIFDVELDKAARVIQRAFRRFINIKVFNFYKNLINFKGKGDPRLLLKCINPQEAELIDAAAGIHVRFRLGGVRFPPNIYYKLFTHRPVVDMCANSPKNYTSPSTKQLLPKQIHNRGAIPVKDFSGWYSRVENNGWRLLTLRAYSSTDQITTTGNRKRITFHHTRMQRKQDVERRQKLRKVDWMKKMYYEGSLHARTEDPNTQILVQRATQGVIQSVEQYGADIIMDWEVDELLTWTNALNYNEYCDDWRIIGTSKSSSAFKGSALIRSAYDTYEFSRLSLSSQDSTANIMT
ncbi:protein MFI [Bombina bombina]|uniref:protein MFI n=1 Tax=Bombina bombina TaxID=8345 RepID=UPI00235A79D4|nr:protein MFI [Bombina bombina]